MGIMGFAWIRQVILIRSREISAFRITMMGYTWIPRTITRSRGTIVPRMKTMELDYYLPPIIPYSETFYLIIKLAFLLKIRY